MSKGARGGITCFIIDGKPKGLTLREVSSFVHGRPMNSHSTTPKFPENRLGDEGQGFALCERWLVGRVPYAAGCIGIAQEALRDCDPTGLVIGGHLVRR